jgi:Type ISP C-terminal specificity domain/N-6 DNA Methylase
VRSRLLRDALTRELIRQQKEHEEGRLFGLYRAFQKQVFAELKLKEFADAFAQTLAYGLFLAKLSADTAQVTLGNARKHVPASFGLIRELVNFLEELDKDEYADVRWLVNEILSIINGLKLADIHEDLSFRHRRVRRGIRAKSEEEARLFERDPFVFFYEDYLTKYDSTTRKSRGVYYTPPPVVNFIVRAIDDTLVNTFAIADGLADRKHVTVLDFACGTGTFLVEVFERIRDRASDSMLKLLVQEHLLRHVFGFEYLIAPYTIGHLKLSQYLKDRYEYNLGTKERLAIYLTNTLEPVDPQENFLLPELTAEAKEAQRVKRAQPILGITGNPPYSGHSQNRGQWISNLIDTYKWVREPQHDWSEQRKPLGEQNAKWLQDDYVKFIGFAQWKMEQVSRGVVAIITNHSFLDNPTFRGARQSLLRTLEQIWVIDLHGNTKKKESAPGGGKDENVFDIAQGVAISLFIKKPDAERGIWRADVWGKQLEKYKLLSHLSWEELDWIKVECFEPYFLFVPIDWSEWDHYKEGIFIQDLLHDSDDKFQIFRLGSVGLATGKDAVTVQYVRDDIERIAQDISQMEDKVFKEKYDVSSFSNEWNLKNVRNDVVGVVDKVKAVQPLHYRPYDVRFRFYSGKSKGFLTRPRSEIMQHLRNDWDPDSMSYVPVNVALVTSRLTKGEEFAHVCVVDKLVEVINLSPNTSNNGFVFPLFLRSGLESESEETVDLFGAESENLTPAFRSWL